jgi:ATP-dependent RNA helicase DeaD
MIKLFKRFFKFRKSPKKPTKTVTKTSAKKIKPKIQFKDIGLSPEILSSLEKLGYKEMTPIQEATYPIITAGKDLCGLAETGSGKTAACTIPLVQQIDQNLNAIQGLILVPTRELCIQYVTEIMKISENTGIKPFAVYGGTDKGIQVAKLNDGVHILVATPGRLIDHIYDGVITLSKVKCLILDEADELLDEGFLEDIQFLMSCLIHKHQTLMFSATMADEIKKLADQHMNNPESISLIDKTPTPKSIKHCFTYLSYHRKSSKLEEIFRQEDIEQAIIFCNSRSGVDKLYRSFKGKIENLDFIHGGLNQDVRSAIFWKFKNKKIKTLITTDVTGRGVDFSHITHVINWDLPNGIEQYTHRTGRTGRMGRTGIAINFITQKDLLTLKKIIHAKDLKPVWIGHDPLLENVNDRIQNRKTKTHGNSRPKQRYYKKKQTDYKGKPEPQKKK